MWSRWIKFAVIAHGIMIGCWIVIPPPRVEVVFRGRLTELITTDEVEEPRLASIPVWLPVAGTCTEAPCPSYPESRWYRLVREAEVTVSEAATNLREAVPDASLAPVIPILPGPPLIYVEAAPDVTWGEMMASIDELRDAAGEGARLVLVREPAP